MAYEKLEYFVQRIKEAKPNVDELAIRNISGVFKLIPFIGGLLDNNTVQLYKDIALTNRLNHLEERITHKITEIDGIRLLELVEQNTNLIYSIFAEFSDLILNNDTLKDKLKRNLITPPENSIQFDVNKEFLLVFLSGASASGKDTVFNSLYKTPIGNYGASNCDVLTKITTRSKRNSDGTYHRFVKRTKFQKMLNESKIVFPFSWGVNEYGFDKKQLSYSVRKKIILWCIGTEFEMLREAKEILSELRINNLFILLEAPARDLILRSKTRNLKEVDLKNRLHTITKEVMFIEDNESFIDNLFDLRIDSSNNRSVANIASEIKRKIENLNGS